MQLTPYQTLFSGYTELRTQENTVTQLSLLNGSPVANTRQTSGGVSARVYKNGSWGFASNATTNADGIIAAIRNATDNAAFLDRKQAKSLGNLMSRPYVGQMLLRGKTPNQQTLMDYLKALDAYIVDHCPGLKSRSVTLQILCMEKSILTADGTAFESFLPRTILICSMTADRDGAPVSERESFGGLGEFYDHFDDPAKMYEKIDTLYEHLMRKKEGVYAEKGKKVCILDADLAGILAHEAIGHTVEADFVLTGSIAGSYLGKEAAGEKVTLIDFAHTYEGKPCPIPIYCDDEGTAAKDAVIIENGILKGYMHSKASALKFGVEPTGNGRAYRFSDEPLIRMRNTAIARGTDKLEDMIASVEDGYYLQNPGNGQADATSEFMFAVTRGREIKNGKLGKALLDTTISGIAFDVLKSVTMVSDDFKWVCSGMCGKKQPIPVGMGGPALKCTITIG